MRSVRPPSCGHSVRRHLRTNSEGIWVTDSVLARAFERYCAASPAARRHVSFVPGPLESRRRLGRRHMTELYSFQSHASLPPWALDMPPDLSNWNWRPPTPEINSINSSMVNTSEDRSAQRWLPNFLDPSSRRVETAIPMDSEADGPSLGEDDVERDMQWLMEQIRFKGSADIQPSIDIFTDSLKAHAKNGDLERRHLYQVLATLPTLLVANHNKEGPPAGLASLLDGICEAAGLVNVRSNKSQCPASFWANVLDQLAILRGQPSACDIFAKVMSFIQPHDVHDVRHSIKALLVSVSKNLSTLQRAGPSSKAATAHAADIATEVYKHPELWPRAIKHIPYQRYAIPITEGLKYLEGTRLAATLPHLITAAVRSTTQRNGHKIRLFWLSVLARLPFVRQKLLFKMMSQLCGTDCASRKLSDQETIQLLVLHWTSQGYLARPLDILPLRPDKSLPPLPVMVELIVTLCREMESPRQLSMLESLCKCLIHTGRLGGVVDLSEALCLTSDILHARALVLLAVACPDHVLVMKLRSFTFRHADKLPEGTKKLIKERWNWRFWAAKTKELCRDPSIDPKDMRRVLEMRQVRISRKRHDANMKEAKRTKFLSKRTVQRIEESARQIATYIAMEAQPGREFHRTALHLVRHRINWLRSFGIKPTAPLLDTLTRLLMVDLQKGDLGRNTRFRWLLKLIRDSQGAAAADAVARELTHWRSRNLNLRLGTLTQKRTEERREEEIRRLDEALRDEEGVIVNEPPPDEGLRGEEYA